MISPPKCRPLKDYLLLRDTWREKEKKKGYSSYVRRTLVKDYNYKHACMKLAERIYIKISRRPAAAA